jgi:uracil-DNA glycosylase
MQKGPATTSAADFLPARLTLSSLRSAAKTCQGCPLYQNATQTVFGRGPVTARIVLVGETPGNDEDLAGEPFVGPAGRLLDTALEAAGISRDDAYVTNVVKHFKWTPQGKRRIHKKPSSREIRACRPWLEKEIEVIHPDVLVCLGATAAQALLRADFRVTAQRGKEIQSALAPHVVATVHPSSVLRQQTDADRWREMDLFIADLKTVARILQRAG